MSSPLHIGLSEVLLDTHVVKVGCFCDFPHGHRMLVGPFDQPPGVALSPTLTSGKGPLPPRFAEAAPRHVGVVALGASAEDGLRPWPRKVSHPPGI